MGNRTLHALRYPPRGATLVRPEPICYPILAGARHPRQGTLMAQAPTVLLAEIDNTATQLQSFILERAGFQVITARGGTDLLRLARQRRVDLILSEVLLPDGDGIEICRLLRADWNTRFIPFVLLTSLADAEYRVRGLLAGADDYIAKPFDLSELS